MRSEGNNTISKEARKLSGPYIPLGRGQFEGRLRMLHIDMAGSVCGMTQDVLCSLGWEHCGQIQRRRQKLDSTKMAVASRFRDPGQAVPAALWQECAIKYRD